MSPSVAGIVGIVALLVLMMARVPIAFTFMLVGAAGTYFLGSKAAMMSVFSTAPWTWASYYILLCLPLFILMGNLASRTGISGDLFVAANKWLGRLPGGLAIATMAACTGFAACTGSSVASAAAMGTITLPEMKKYKYDMRLATGTVAIGGTLGILIPPSGNFIVYGVLTDESIGQLFMAGVVPGLMLSLMYVTAIYVRARRNPAMAPPGPQFPAIEKLRSLKSVWGMLFLFALVMGGIWGGVFTPTEAAGVGAFGALVLGLVRRRLSRKNLTDSLFDTMRTTGLVFAIVIGAMMFNTFMTLSHLPGVVSEWVGGLPIPPLAVVAVILLIYVPLGMVMDALAMVVLTVPIFYPIITSFGFSGIWFGVLLTAMVEIGMITPPVGMNCFVIAGVAKDVPLEDVFRGIMPFAVVAMVGVAILTVLPQISLWLPNTMLR